MLKIRLAGSSSLASVSSLGEEISLAYKAFGICLRYLFDSHSENIATEARFVYLLLLWASYEPNAVLGHAVHVSGGHVSGEGIKRLAVKGNLG